jgi:hypothetical protein
MKTEIKNACISGGGDVALVGGGSCSSTVRGGCLSSPSRLRRHRVSFKEVQVREFNRTIGDNPSCSSGCPIRYVEYCIINSVYVSAYMCVLD